MIFQTPDNNLRAFVAIFQRQDTSCTAQTISETTPVPAPYLYLPKTLQGMARSISHTSQRGLRGRLVLTNNPSVLTIRKEEDAFTDPLAHHGSVLPLCNDGTPQVGELTNTTKLVNESKSQLPIDRNRMN